MVFGAALKADSQAPSLLSTCAGIHLILIWGPLAAAVKKLREKQDE
jgi:hypothetical protein